MAEGDALCADYLRRLTAALSEVPGPDRDLTLEQIRDHLAEARATLPVQTEAGVQQILRRLGPPEEIARAALDEVETPGAAERRVRGRTALAVALALVALGLGTAALTGAFGSDQTPRAHSALPARVAVPDVLGLDQAEAAAVLSATGFHPEIRPSPSAGAEPPGTVVGQSPPAGFEAPRKSRVSISASRDVYSGTPGSPTGGVQMIAPASMVVVPNVVGLNQAQAVAALTTRGLEANVSKADGLSVRKELPQAGATVPPDSEVVVDMG